MMDFKTYKVHYIITVILIIFINYVLYRMIVFEKDQVEELFAIDPDEDSMICVSSTFLLSSLFSNKFNHGWTWKCVEGKCVKSKALSKVTHDVYKTLEICQLTCGPFGALWPKPTGQINFSKEVIPFHPNQIKFDLKVAQKKADLNSNPLILQISRQFIKDLKNVCNSKCFSICDPEVYIRINVDSSESNLTWETNEAYNLTLNMSDSRLTVIIEAETVFGARHGLQTLFQLTTVITKHGVRYLFVTKKVSITDKPMYPHRGLLIDTSRNYLRLETIKKIIDGMGHSKLNVLHWHATDSQSFPLQLPRVPQLSKYGAYSFEEVYTTQNIKEIINYARTRGIRIIIEVDTPAHVGSGWQWGESVNFGPLMHYTSNCEEPPCGQLNLANPNIYTILSELYNDLVDAFPRQEVFHIGGDEVQIEYWNSSEEMKNYMKNQGLSINESGYLELWANFHKKCVQIIDTITGNSHTPVILWSSQLTKPPKIQNFIDNKRFIVQTWVNQSDPLPTQLLEHEYKIIITTRNIWDFTQTNYPTWKDVYDNKIPEFSKGVLGGEVCMWRDYVDDYSISLRIWPRATAFAERMWTDPEDLNVMSAFRFMQQRERLAKLGIHGEVIATKWCYQNNDKCT